MKISVHSFSLSLSATGTTAKGIFIPSTATPFTEYYYCYSEEPLLLGALTYERGSFLRLLIDRVSESSSPLFKLWYLLS